MNQKEVKQILNMTKNIEYIYFDCFDTLIKRKYSISYCFYRLANMLILEYAFPFDQLILSNSLYNMFTRCNVDFSIIVKDVYLHYKPFIKKPFNIFFDEFKNEFISAELDNIELDDNVELLFEELKGKRIFLLSDYYLGKDIVIKFFEKLTKNNPFTEIFISCDYLSSKEDGTLYTVVENPSTSLMVGDNLRSDIINASKIGMRTVKIDSQKNYDRYRLFDVKYKKNEVNELFKLRNRNKKTYVSNYAFLLFHFCKKLYSELENLDVIYFLSRDGYFLKKCFDIFLSKNNKKNIKTKYLETSRIAMLVPSLEDDDLYPENFKKKFVQRTQWKIKNGNELLRVIGFDENEIKQFHLSKEKNDNYFESQEYNSLFCNKDFIELLAYHKNDARNRFNKLVSEAGNKLIIVDLGWQGTSQNDMRKVLNKDIVLIGYYLGTTRCIGEITNSIKKGIIFDYGLDNYKSYFEYFDIEGLLKTNCGQLVSYSSNGDVYIDDDGLKTYEVYSKECQKVALNLFFKLCDIDLHKPISFSGLQLVMNKVIERKGLTSWTWGFFYYNAQNKNEGKLSPTVNDYLECLKYRMINKQSALYYFLKNIRNFFIRR